MSKDNNKKTPKVRFPGFDKDWEERKLGEVCDFINGDRSSNYPSDADFQDSGIPFVGSDSLGATFVNKNKLRFISCEKYKQMKGLKIQDKDILYTLRGAGFGKCSISDFFDGTVASSLVGIRCNEEELEPYFFVQWLNSANAGNEKKKAVNGSTAQNISVDDMKKYMIYLPLQDEQQKVGAYFRNLDHLITLHQRKLEKLKEYKKGMLQKMFPKNGEKIPEVRFSGFDGEWEERKLSELATMHARIGWQNLRTSEFLDNGDYMLITGTDFNDGVVNYSTCHYVEKERYEQDKNIQIHNGSILITKDGTLGKVAYVQGLTMPATLNAGVFNIEIKDKKTTDEKYLYQYLKAPFLMDYVSKKATGGTIKHLNQNILVDFPVAIPEKAEQQKIGSFFQDLDRLITLQQKKIESLKEFKKGCLQQMFV